MPHETEVFYTSPDSIHGNLITLGPDEAKHIARVLRHKPGDHIQVVDGEGNEYRCIITRIGRTELLAEVVSQTRRAREPVVEVTLAPAVLKGAKMDLVVEMATELGVARIAPVITGRTIGTLTNARLRRFRNLAIAALKSSTRTMLPGIRPAARLADLLKETSIYDLKLIAYEGERSVHLPDVVTSSPHRAILLIGPEGGFTDEEVALTQAHGFRSFSLGPRRLRAETACIAALAMLLYQFKEL